MISGMRSQLALASQPKAIASRSRRLAVEALMSHPLVLTFPRAKGLVDDYLSANGEFVGYWGD